jgi:hypothetical protein
MALPSSARLVAVAAGLALLLGGCSAATADQGASTTAASSTPGADFPEGPGPEDRPDPALAGEPVPTLPPGDPGTGTSPDARTGDGGHEEDGGHGEDDGDGHESHRVTSVPEAALVDAATVAALAGGDWSVDPDGGSAGAAASRTVTLTAPDGVLAQTVSAFRSPLAAREAVAAEATRLAGCGFAADGDPRLGEASAQLTKDTGTGRQLALVLAAEGATVVLVGSGSAADQAVWPSLADVALGTACAAGVHGCH